MLRGRSRRRKDKTAFKPIQKFHREYHQRFQAKRKYCFHCRVKRIRFHHKYCQGCWDELKEKEKIARGDINY